ncbi:MAG: ATP-binding protein, partial [Duncaniella sp.]|nr:ATP-binding protein [Duncaniella sp.]
MKDLKGIRGAYYIASLIEEGEHEHQDFKFAISDARKIARSLAAFANNSGGRLLIGVKDNGQIAGVRSDEDVYLVEQAAEMYCRPTQKVTSTAFRCEGGRLVVRVEIEAAPPDRRPVAVRESDGKLRCYFRVADENILVPPLVEKAWRHRAADPQLSFTPTPERLTLLSLASAAEGTSLDRFMLEAHLSESAATRAIIDAHA